MVVRCGGPSRRVATVHGLHPGYDPESDPAAASGYDRRASARTGRAGLRGRTAAAQSTGLHYYDESPAGQRDPNDRERELLIASIDELSPDDRRHVAALVESLRNRAIPDQQLPAAELALGDPEGGERRYDRYAGPRGNEAADRTVRGPVAA